MNVFAFLECFSKGLKKSAGENSSGFTLSLFRLSLYKIFKTCSLQKNVLSVSFNFRTFFLIQRGSMNFNSVNIYPNI